MVDMDTDFFKSTDNFTKTASISSIQIVKSNLNFTPKVTIAIPTYKRAPLLKEAIDSAINQVGYEFYDIIVVDNDPERGCETEKLLMDYNSKRISYYKNSENIGMAGNWNRLFELAKGDYVVMLHDDDLILPSFLEECIFFVNKEPDLGIINPLKISFTKPLTKFEIESYTQGNLNKIATLKRLFDIDNYFSYSLGPPSGTLFNKKAVLKIGGFNNDYFPSIDYFFSTLFSLHFSVYVLNRYLTLYRYDCNESLKESTMRSFIVNDFYLRKSILKKYMLPEFLAKKFLANTSILFINNCKSINNNFQFNLDELNITKSSLIESRVINFLVKIHMKFLKFILLNKIFIKQYFS